MKVITVLHYPAFSGPHNQTLQIADPLKQQGIEVIAILPEGSGASRLLAGGIKVEILNLSRVRMARDPRIHATWCSRFPFDVRNLVKIFRRYNPDIVQLTSLVNFQAAIAARILNIPVTWQLVDTFPPAIIRRLAMYPIGLLADSLMPIGYRVAEAHPGAERFGERMVIFYPPVNTSTFNPSNVKGQHLRSELGVPRDAPLVGVVGNVNPQKGYEFFIDAAGAVLREFPEAHFVIAGHIYSNHRNYYERLLARARERDLTPGGNLHFLGSRSDVPDILASIDVFALASVPNSEGTPTAILEAMASGKPVVATDVGSVSEVVHDGFTGYVVPSLRPDKMAVALIDLLGNKEKRTAFGREARRRVEQEFSLEACVEAHVKAFELAIEHHNGGRG